MKVASFIIATLFIPPYPTNLVITTSPWVIGVRFRPPPLIMTVTCSLFVVVGLSRWPVALALCFVTRLMRTDC